MMPATISEKKSDVYEALRAFIQGLIGNDVEVVIGLGNRVPQPNADGFVTITAISSTRQATNVDSDIDNFPTGPGVTTSEQSTKLRIQIDFFGPLSNTWATIVSTLFRDPYAVDALAPVCAPLFADDPILMPQVTAEDQYLERWMLNAELQYNPVTTTAQNFSATIAIEAIDVDVRFPP